MALLIVLGIPLAVFPVDWPVKTRRELRRSMATGRVASPASSKQFIQSRQPVGACNQRSLRARRASRSAASCARSCSEVAQRPRGDYRRFAFPQFRRDCSWRDDSYSRRNM